MSNNKNNEKLEIQLHKIEYYMFSKISQLFGTNNKYTISICLNAANKFNLADKSRELIEKKASIITNDIKHDYLNMENNRNLAIKEYNKTFINLTNQEIENKKINLREVQNKINKGGLNPKSDNKKLKNLNLKTNNIKKEIQILEYLRDTYILNLVKFENSMNNIRIETDFSQSFIKIKSEYTNLSTSGKEKKISYKLVERDIQMLKLENKSIKIKQQKVQEKLVQGIYLLYSKLLLDINIF